MASLDTHDQRIDLLGTVVSVHGGVNRVPLHVVLCF
jgi:hypothetical protein